MKSGAIVPTLHQNQRVNNRCLIYETSAPAGERDQVFVAAGVAFDPQKAVFEEPVLRVVVELPHDERWERAAFGVEAGDHPVIGAQSTRPGTRYFPTAAVLAWRRSPVQLAIDQPM